MTYRNWRIFADPLPDKRFTEIRHQWRIKNAEGETWSGHAPTFVDALQAARNAVDYAEDGYVKSPSAK